MKQEVPRKCEERGMRERGKERKQERGEEGWARSPAAHHSPSGSLLTNVKSELASFPFLVSLPLFSSLPAPLPFLATSPCRLFAVISTFCIISMFLSCMLFLHLFSLISWFIRTLQLFHLILVISHFLLIVFFSYWQFSFFLFIARTLFTLAFPSSVQPLSSPPSLRHCVKVEDTKENVKQHRFNPFSLFSPVREDIKPSTTCLPPWKESPMLFRLQSQRRVENAPNY